MASKSHPLTATLLACDLQCLQQSINDIGNCLDNLDAAPKHEPVPMSSVTLGQRKSAAHKSKNYRQELEENIEILATRLEYLRTQSLIRPVLDMSQDKLNSINLIRSVAMHAANSGDADRFATDLSRANVELEDIYVVPPCRAAVEEWRPSNPASAESFKNEGDLVDWNDVPDVEEAYKREQLREVNSKAREKIRFHRRNVDIGWEQIFQDPMEKYEWYKATYGAAWTVRGGPLNSSAPDDLDGSESSDSDHGQPEGSHSQSDEETEANNSGQPESAHSQSDEEMAAGNEVRSEYTEVQSDEEMAAGDCGQSESVHSQSDEEMAAGDCGQPESVHSQSDEEMAAGDYGQSESVHSQSDEEMAISDNAQLENTQVQSDEEMADNDTQPSSPRAKADKEMEANGSKKNSVRVQDDEEMGTRDAGPGHIQTQSEKEIKALKKARKAKKKAKKATKKAKRAEKKARKATRKAEKKARKATRRAEKKAGKTQLEKQQETNG